MTHIFHSSIRILALFVLLRTASCASPRAYRQPPVMPHGLVYAVPHQLDVLFIFQHVAEQYFGMSFKDTWKTAKITWVEPSCDTGSSPSFHLEGKCYHGIMWTCDTIFVTSTFDSKLCDSALIHEFAHCVVEKHPAYTGDPTHSTPIWPLVEQVNELVCHLGW